MVCRVDTKCGILVPSDQLSATTLVLVGHRFGTRVTEEQPQALKPKEPETPKP